MKTTSQESKSHDDSQSLHQSSAPQNQQWLPSHEHVLQKWARDAQLFSGLHLQASGMYYFWGRLLNIPVIFFTAAGGIAELGISNEDLSTWIQIVKGVILLLLFCMSLIAHYFNFLALAAKHKTSSVSYEDLFRSIEEQIAFSSDARESPGLFMKQIRQQFFTLRKNSPDISSHVIKTYVNDLKRLQETLPSGVESYNIDLNGEDVNKTNPIFASRTVQLAISSDKGDNFDNSDQDQDPVILLTRKELSAKGVQVGPEK